MEYWTWLCPNSLTSPIHWCLLTLTSAALVSTQVPVSSPVAQTPGVSRGLCSASHIRVFLELQGIYGLGMKCLLKRLVLKA